MKTVSPVTMLPAQSGPSVDIKKQSPICLSTTGSRHTIYWAVAIAHSHLMTFVISIPLHTVSSSTLAGKETKRRAFLLLRLWQGCSLLTLLLEVCFFVCAKFSVNQNWSFERLNWHFLSILIIQGPNNRLTCIFPTVIHRHKMSMLI